MDCDDYRLLISQQLDEVLPTVDHDQLAAHLPDCEDCRTFADRLTATDRLLHQSVLHESRRALESAEETRQMLRRTEQLSPLLRTGWQIGLSATAGFLAASILFLLRAAPTDLPEQTFDGDVGVPVGAMNHPVARIQDYVGAVHYRPADQAQWQTVGAAPSRTCEVNTVIRTEAGGLCELQTMAGGCIRIAEHSEVAVLAADRLQLRQGQLWCRSPDDRPLQVVPAAKVTADGPDGAAATLAEQSIGFFCCPTGQDGGTDSVTALEVAEATGTVQLSAEGDVVELQPGQRGMCFSGNRPVAQQHAVTGQDMHWMRPLLYRQGYDSPELSAQVTRLLARLGAAKMAHLSAAEIRSLGEFSVLPMLRYVQSEESRESVGRRRQAMQIAADLCPVWGIPELLQLAEDADEEIRSTAGRALQRLTGLAPGDGDMPTSIMQPWQAWWQQYGAACPEPERELVRSVSF